MISSRLAVLLDCAVKIQGDEITCDPPRTPEQIADALAQAETEEQAAQEAAEVETANETTIAGKLEQRLADLQAIIDRPNTTLGDNTVGAIRQAIRDVQLEVKTLARVDRMQTRKLIRLLDGTD